LSFQAGIFKELLPNGFVFPLVVAEVTGGTGERYLVSAVFPKNKDDPEPKAFERPKEKKNKTKN
jgi:hypothetical protein